VGWFAPAFRPWRRNTRLSLFAKVGAKADELQPKLPSLISMVEKHSIRKAFFRLAPALTCLFISCTWAQTAGDNHGAIASALQSRDFDKALQLLQPALRDSPGNAQLWAMQGAAYTGGGHKQEALASYRAALKISPDYLPALHGAAQIEYDAGSSAAIPIIEHVLRLQPADPTSHAMLAVLEYQQGNWAAAVSHFEKTGTLFDSQPSALHAYATCLVTLKRFDRAEKVFERAVALNPEDEQERHLLAAIQLMAKRPGDALATLAPLLQKDNPDAGTLELASSAYEEAKDTSRAVSTLRQAIFLDPQNVNLYLDFANISYTHGSFQVGIDVINDGLGLRPRAAPLYFARGILYAQVAEYDKAEADFGRAYELDPNQSLSSAAQGLAAAQQNDFGRALVKVQESLARKPNDAFMLYLQADILAAKNADPGTPDFQLAMRSAQKAVALQPRLGAARGVLAKLYLKAGRYPEAVEQCRKALESDPTDQTVVYHLIQGLRKTGDKEEIPGLVKRLALLREQTSQRDRERYRYKLVDEDSPR
jgi:tetratricopeptide (TPR) repeat protein